MKFNKRYDDLMEGVDSTPMVCENHLDDYDKEKGIDVDARNKAFKKMADTQRSGAPESLGAFSRTKEPLTSGIYSNALEYVGDITHRLGQSFKYSGGGEAYNKIKNDLRHIIRNEDWYKGIFKDIKSNNEYNKMGLSSIESEDRVRGYGAKYAEAHSGIPVYNKIQWYARQAAIDLGDFNFNGCRENLRKIDKAIDEGDTFWFGLRDYDGKEFDRPNVDSERLSKRKKLIELYDINKKREEEGKPLIPFSSHSDPRISGLGLYDMPE